MNATKTSSISLDLARAVCRSAAVVIVALLGCVSSTGSAAEPDGILPTVPVISIRATVPETREPFCDPAICDALVPAPGVFTITRRGGDLARELFVLLTYGGTASSGADYPALPQTVFFGTGQASVQLLVEPAYDHMPEGDEYVLAQLQPDPTMGPIERYRVDATQSVARVLIRDNETVSPPVVSIEATSPIAEESSYPYRRLALRGRFTITRTGPTDLAMPVFVLAGGTATPGVDYPAMPWLVSIPPGTNRVEIEIVPTADDLAEPIETVEAELSSCPPLTNPPLGIPCYLVNIDPARSSARVFIRDNGITTASIEITAPKDKQEFAAGVSIPVAATAIDLEGAITHVDFFDGDRKVGESSIYFFREPDPGTPIQHEFVWTGAGAGLHELTARGLAANGNAVTSSPVRIQVNDGLPVVSIEATVPETAEPSPTSRIRPGAFTLRRTGATAGTLRVWVAYGGTATSGSDYDTLPGVVEFPAGAASVEVSVVALDDELVEPDENVVATLTPSPLAIPPSYRIDPLHARAAVVIHDSTITPPTPPVVTIIATDAFAREGTNSAGGSDTATFVVTRTGGTNAPFTVLFSVGGTASNGVDYAAISSPVTIPAGQYRARIVIQPLDDRRPEGIETIVITLNEDDSATPGYSLGFPRRAAAILVDNDRPRPPCLALPGGLFNLCLPVTASDCFRVEGTRDMKNWTPLCTVPATEGWAHFVDPDASALPYRFYRCVPVPCEQ